MFYWEIKDAAESERNTHNVIFRSNYIEFDLQPIQKSLLYMVDKQRLAVEIAVWFLAKDLGLPCKRED